MHKNFGPVGTGPDPLIYYPDKEDRALAREMATDLDHLKEKNVAGAKGILTGMFGEIAYSRLRPDARYVGTSSRHWDFVDNKVTVDVKSRTKWGAPTADSFVVVNAQTTKHRMGARRYFFTWVESDHSEVRLLGWLDAKDIRKHGTHYRRDEVVGDSTAHISGWYIPIRELKSPLRMF